MNNTISIDDFMNVAIHVGTVISAKDNVKARKPAYVLEVDFGEKMGIKVTSAQITDKYALHDLPGRQVVAVTNFPPLKIAGVKSEVLVLGVVSESGVVLLKPDEEVANGLKIA